MYYNKLACLVLCLSSLCGPDSALIEPISRYAARIQLSCCSALSRVMLEKTELQNREWEALYTRDRTEAARCLTLAFLLQFILYSVDAEAASDFMLPPVLRPDDFLDSELKMAQEFHELCSNAQLAGLVVLDRPTKPTTAV
jgi:hypothetical protein